MYNGFVGNHPYFMNKLRILFLRAGSGKGTQSARLAENFQISHISTGDLIRSEIKSGSPLGQKIKAIVESGNLVSDDIVNKIVKMKLENSNSFILDGYPRTLEQAKFFATFSDFDFIFDLQIAKEFLFERLSGRRVCSKEKDPNCTGNYHIKFKIPLQDNICDLCGSSIYQRKDDSEESINKRLDTYELETGKPLTDFYASKIIAINANRNPDEVFEDIIKRISPGK